jgi:hypothetical protein
MVSDTGIWSKRKFFIKKCEGRIGNENEFRIQNSKYRIQNSKFKKSLLELSETPLMRASLPLSRKCKTPLLN